MLLDLRNMYTWQSGNKIINVNTNGSWFVSGGTATTTTSYHANSFICGNSSTVTVSTNSITKLFY
jgi:hypothetical protein